MSNARNISRLPQLGTGNASLMKNRIINGAMVIDQRNAGASVTPTTSGTYTLDRWSALFNSASKFSVQQNAGSVTPPTGFNNYLGATSLSSYSVGAGDYFFLCHRIEGYNTSDLGWGTANGKTVTLSFWAYSSLTGTFGASIDNYNASSVYPFSYSIPVANTWTQIAVTIPAPPNATSWQTTTSVGLELRISLGAGSTFSGTANAWTTSNHVSTTGATSVVGTSGATFYITGVQLEAGSQATGYEYRQYGQELALCQRYYQTTGFVVGSAANTTILQGAITYPTKMRTVTPTLGINAVLRVTDGYAANPIQSSISFSINSQQDNYINAQLNNFSGMVQGRLYIALGQSSSDAFTLSAEL